MRGVSLLIIPALLIRTSRWPNSFDTLEAAAEMDDWSVTSSWRRENEAFGWEVWSFSRAAWPLVRERLPIMMW